MERETEITQDQVYQELKRLFSDEKLHEMPEEELEDLFYHIILLLKMKKKKRTKEEEALIYI